jgi:GMP synthase-like glutamine amidotransferase
MKIAILQTGKTNPAMPARFQDYPALFTGMFASDPRAAQHSFAAVPVVDGEMPPSVDSYDAYIITGSKHGVYDDLPWIAPLTELIRAAHDADIPLVGVCFGHQIIAHALGGHAAKSDRGWGLGVHRVGLHDHPDWMPADDDIRLIHIHQDQVETLPPGAQLIGSNGFCPHAMFVIGDNVLCVQGHPEFTIAYIDQLMQVRADLFDPETLEAAQASLDDGHDGKRFSSWILSFLDAHQHRRAAA